MAASPAAKTSPASMTLSPIGEAALIAREGRSLKAYRDSVGVLTIGIGITSESGLITVTPGLTISAAECDALFHRAKEKYVEPVRRGLKVAVTPNMFDALVSICFNIGPGAFAKSTFLKRVNAGDAAGAHEAILRWDKPAVVISRRRAEAEQFLTPYTVKLPSARYGERPIPIAATVKEVLDPAQKTPVVVPIIAAPKPTRTEAVKAAASRPVRAVARAPQVAARSTGSVWLRLAQAFDAFWAPLPRRA